MSVTAMLGGAPAAAANQLETAISLARKLKTTLTGLVVMPDPANAFMYVSGPEVVMAGATGIEAVIAAQDEAVDALKQAFDEAVKAAGPWLRSEFVRETGSVAYRGASAATLSEAFVFPHRAADSDHALNPAFEHILMDARLPMVLASEKPTTDGPCIIAWDGSAQAARAVRLHMPMIRAIGHAVIVQNPDKLRDDIESVLAPSPEMLANWLQQERIDTRIETFSGKTSAGLLAMAEKFEASTIVMGAYGHSRLGEFLFGGTSRALLNNPDAPALAISH